MLESWYYDNQILAQILPKLPFLLFGSSSQQPIMQAQTGEVRKKVISMATTCKLQTGGDISMWLDGCGHSESG